MTQDSSKSQDEMWTKTIRCVCIYIVYPQVCTYIEGGKGPRIQWINYRRPRNSIRQVTTKSHYDTWAHRLEEPVSKFPVSSIILRSDIKVSNLISSIFSRFATLTRNSLTYWFSIMSGACIGVPWLTSTYFQILQFQSLNNISINSEPKKVPFMWGL